MTTTETTIEDRQGSMPRRARRLRRLGAGLAVAGVLGAAGVAGAHHTGFPDIDNGDPGAYFHEPVNWAVGNGITDGYGNTGLFRPELEITRGEVVTFLHRYHENLAPASETLAASTVLVPTGAPAPNNFVATLGKHIGGAAAVRVGPGTYRVVFARDISPCLYQATVQGSAARTATVNPGPNDSTVQVTVRNENGSLVDGVIHVAATCPAS